MAGTSFVTAEDLGLSLTIILFKMLRKWKKEAEMAHYQICM